MPAAEQQLRRGDLSTPSELLHSHYSSYFYTFHFLTCYTQNYWFMHVTIKVSLSSFHPLDKQIIFSIFCVGPLKILPLVASGSDLTDGYVHSPIWTNRSPGYNSVFYGIWNLHSVDFLFWEELLSVFKCQLITGLTEFHRMTWFHLRDVRPWLNLTPAPWTGTKNKERKTLYKCNFQRCILVGLSVIE